MNDIRNKHIKNQLHLNNQYQIKESLSPQKLEKQRSKGNKSSNNPISRRIILPIISLPLLLKSNTPAQANIIQDAARNFYRPDISETQAIIILLDARGVLLELKIAAETKKGSKERKQLNPILPNFARRLRDVGKAAPVVAEMSTGINKEFNLSETYGGLAKEGNKTLETLFVSIGSVLTYSGRTVRPEVLDRTFEINNSIVAIEDFLKQVPENELKKAREERAKRK